MADYRNVQNNGRLIERLLFCALLGKSSARRPCYVPTFVTNSLVKEISGLRWLGKADSANENPCNFKLCDLSK